MSSILTNTSAMIALQSLKSINDDLNMTQNQISTGKMVANASDNAAVWAISKVMQSDVTGFTGISNSLALGSSTVAVASQAASSVTDLLTKMKAKIVVGAGRERRQDENPDRHRRAEGTDQDGRRRGPVQRAEPCRWQYGAIDHRAGLAGP